MSRNSDTSTMAEDHMAIDCDTNGGARFDVTGATYLSNVCLSETIVHTQCCVTCWSSDSWHVRLTCHSL